jgi:hypothetical protein
LLELNTVRKQNREYEEELMGVYKKRKQAAGARRMSTVLRETQQDREVVLKQVLVVLPERIFHFNLLVGVQNHFPLAHGRWNRWRTS